MEKKLNLDRRTFVAGSAIAAATLGLGLYGCGGSSDSKGEDGGDAAAVGGGTIYAASAYDTTGGIDPVGLANGSAIALPALVHCLEGLYCIDFRDYSIYNGLAAGDPVEVGENVYEIALREGALFSDGATVTADDVVNALEMNMAGGTAAPFLTFIDSVEAKDESTVTLTLAYPFSLIKERLALVMVFPATMSEEDRQTRPIGSGPWMLDSINMADGGELTFLPNPNYNGIADFAPTAAAMSWKPMKADATARVTALSEGTVCAAEEIPDANVEQLTAAGVTVEYDQRMQQPFLMFNTKKEPLNDARVRQAFFYAIDVEKLISNAMSGHGAPVTSFVPEAHPAYTQASTVYTYDPEKAKELLKEAGVENLSITLTVNNNWVNDLSAQIKNDLEAVGIACQLDPQSIVWADYDEPAEGDILPYDVMLTPGDPGCFGEDPDLWMSWWYADNSWTQGRTCWKGSEKWEELQVLMQGARELEGDEQKAEWAKCFDLLSEEVPLYALFHCERATGYRPEQIEDFKPISTTGLIFLGTTPTA